MAAPLLGRGQTFETSVSEYSTPVERGGGCRGGCWHRKESAERAGVATTDKGMKWRLPCGTTRLVLPHNNI